MRPRIGITTSPSLHEGRFSEALDRAYVTAVLRAGGLPVILPVIGPAQAPKVAACLDGIAFSGGGDVDPALYGGDRVPELRGVSARRDAYEVALVRQALELGLPMLGTCRGCQLLNVALGGTLVPHLAGADGRHSARDRWAEPVHTVSVLEGSVLRTVLGPGVVGVNSLHHQAVAEVGTGLRAVAWADDGVIEAVEGVDGNRALGVQWHPELLLTPPGNATLFRWLVDEARRPRSVARVTSDAPPEEPVSEAAELAGAAA
ncbi:MAG TPA: gamma-glutamyl-gamma-aminobutyrate hydrolase family protein [Acidimicrobiales bacterium]|jgi:putative glutamine amidotransferase|nr:gamma-glutamyl-gamma-aminobutyrate hydrolase family protein [Acidimicrobiales bacterium]